LKINCRLTWTTPAVPLFILLTLSERRPNRAEH
jgi:hypothetical protein